MFRKNILIVLLAMFCAVSDAQPKLSAWLMKTDCSQFTWVTEKYNWGNGYMTVSPSSIGTKRTVHPPKEVIDFNTNNVSTTDRATFFSPVTVKRERHLDNSDIVESYIFSNRSKQSLSLSNIGIYVPFNDNYPDAQTCMTSRYNVHIWPGGRAAWVDVVPMNGKEKCLALTVTEGEITNYEVWERGIKKGSSNFRGVLALCPPDITLRPGKSYRLTWRIFEHSFVDFADQLVRRGGTAVTADRYVYEVGQMAKITFRNNKGTRVVKVKVKQNGENRVYDGDAFADIYGVSSEQELLGKRVDFIVNHQQMKDPGDERYGALMVYDNEGDSIVTDYQGRSDLSDGRERLGMGVLLAEYCLRHPDPQAKKALALYANFVRTKLQDEDYTTYSDARHLWNQRGYNYPWVADFYFRMFMLTGNKQYALDGYGTYRALYRRFGHGFYCIGYPVLLAMEALKKAGMESERKFLLYDLKQTADIFIKNGINFPKFEVNYEQSIVAPAVQFLCEMYLYTKEQKYLDGAKKLMPPLEAFNGHQPSFRMNDIAIRHWDGYWFGKRQMWGDVFPHYWSAITAVAFHYYAIAVGDSSYQKRAENIVRCNLCQFFENGRATCAFVNPRRVNGETAHFNDPYANDQDWALVYYMLVMK